MSLTSCTGHAVSEQGAPLDPELLFTTLARHQVQFVLIGALAARLQGFPRFTRDADITPARDATNLQRLATALRELDARIYTEKIPEGLAFDCSPQMLTRADTWNLTTKAGRLDLAFQPSGTTGFTDLAPQAHHSVERSGRTATGQAGCRGDERDAQETVKLKTC